MAQETSRRLLGHYSSAILRLRCPSSSRTLPVVVLVQVQVQVQVLRLVVVVSNEKQKEQEKKLAFVDVPWVFFVPGRTAPCLRSNRR